MQTKIFIIILTLLVLLVAGVGAMLMFGQNLPSRAGELAYKNITCPDPFIFQLPVDINKATSILYPGQVRGGDFKAHGGFRFDGLTNDEVTVTAPYDAKITAAARYIEFGTVQYMFDFTHPCGIQYRLDHLKTLEPKLQTIVEKLPPPAEGNSRTKVVRPAVAVKQGEVLATAVGMARTDSSASEPSLRGANTFVDWGVYDRRQKNASSQDPAWVAAHPYELAHYGVCWFDWLSAEDEAKVRTVTSGNSQDDKSSDYCE